MANDLRLDAPSPRRTWIWILLVLAILLLLGWWLWPMIWPAPSEEEPVAPRGPAVTTPAEREVAVDTGAEPVVETDLLAVGLQASIGDILDDPDLFRGETVPLTEVQVAEVPTDRGFWIENEGRRLFAVIVDVPEEEPKDIEAGQTLRIEGGVLHGPEILPEIPGRPLDADTETIIRDQPIFLVVDERSIEIL